MSNHIHKCGYKDDGPEDEAWKCEITCTLCGCKGCKHFDGTEHFVSNIPKGMAMWAKHERKKEGAGG